MNTIVVSQFKHSQDAALVVSLIKKMNGKAKKMTEAEWEDFVLGRIAEEAETGEDASREEVSKIFKRHGIDF